MRALPVFLVLLTIGMISGPAAGIGDAVAQPVCPAPGNIRFEIERRFARDMPGFTEGLEVHDGDLYESTGALAGGTRLLRITPQGRVTLLRDLGTRFFGEGLTFLGAQIFQLSWQDHKVFVYDSHARLIRTMANSHEGWGLTNNGRDLIFSDGGDGLYFADPANFRILHSLRVRRIASPVTQINELEYVEGKIYANIWQTRTIVRIDAASGCIEAEADMAPLWARMSQAEQARIAADPDSVLNGIAYDSRLRLFYVTGKDWPMIFAGRFRDQ